MEWANWYADMTNDQKKLVNDYYPYSRKYIATEMKKYHETMFVSSELEDVIEESSLKTLFKSAKYFDPKRGFTFKTFFHLNWHREKSKAVQALTSRYKKNLALREKLALQYQEFESILDTLIRAETENAKAKITQKILSKLNLLDKKDRDIFQKSFWENKTDLKIGREVGCSKANVWQRKDRALKRLRRAMGAPFMFKP